MANSRIGQYRLEYLIDGYVAPVRSHVVGLWVVPTFEPNIGDLPADIDLRLLSGGFKTLQDSADEFCGFLRRMYSLSENVEQFSLWRYTTEFQREFISAGIAVPGVVGVGATQVSQQHTFTFRHAGGGVGKVVMLENNVPGDTSSSFTPNPTGNDSQRFGAFLLSANSPMIALDNTFPITALRSSLGQNEAVWRKVFRN